MNDLMKLAGILKMKTASDHLSMKTAGLMSHGGVSDMQKILESVPKQEPAPKYPPAVAGDRNREARWDRLNQMLDANQEAFNKAPYPTKLRADGLDITPVEIKPGALGQPDTVAYRPLEGKERLALNYMSPYYIKEVMDSMKLFPKYDERGGLLSSWNYPKAVKGDAGREAQYRKRYWQTEDAQKLHDATAANEEPGFWGKIWQNAKDGTLVDDMLYGIQTGVSKLPTGALHLAAGADRIARTAGNGIANAGTWAANLFRKDDRPYRRLIAGPSPLAETAEKMEEGINRFDAPLFRALSPKTWAHVWRRGVPPDNMNEPMQPSYGGTGRRIVDTALGVPGELLAGHAGSKAIESLPALSKLLPAYEAADKASHAASALGELYPAR